MRRSFTLGAIVRSSPARDMAVLRYGGPQQLQCASARKDGNTALAYTAVGDSGGPLVHEHHDIGNNIVEWRLLGITSLGIAANNNFPNVFTRTSLYCTWITEVTNWDVVCSLT
uniref:Peptidase S1 domain-containing protein n=1 Tax=Steinernema glaseri TaxID=37863 RepID=A0A1I7Z9T9_9BILA